MSEIRVTEEHREKAAAIVQASFFHGVAHADIATVLATALAEQEAAVWEKAAEEVPPDDNPPVDSDGMRTGRPSRTARAAAAPRRPAPRHPDL